MERTNTIDIIRLRDGEMELIEDTVISEYPLTIFINEKELVTLLCSPEGLEYLAVGFLVSEGIIKNMEQIEKVSIDKDRGHAYVDLKNKSIFTEELFGKRTITTGCGKGTVFYNVLDSLGTKKINHPIKIESQKILELSRKLNDESQLFRETGGVHSCALCDEERIILFHEDVGRHNALDKIIGEALLLGLNLNDKILISSGRISSEMIIKTIKNNIPMIVSRSAPTDLSVEIAKQFHVTLIGFARGNRMNIYNGAENLTIK